MIKVLVPPIQPGVILVDADGHRYWYSESQIERHIATCQQALAQSRFGVIENAT